MMNQKELERICKSMSLTTQFKWEIRQEYIKTLLKGGMNPKWLQMELPHISNDQMADMIKCMIKWGVLKE